MKKKTIKRFGIIGGIALVMGLVLSGCASMVIVSLDSVEGPAQVRQYEDMDPKAITVWASYKDGSRSILSIVSSNITFDKNTVGPQTVTIERGGYRIRFETEVMALVSVHVVPPTQTIYAYLMRPNIDGLDAQGEWDQMGRFSLGVGWDQYGRPIQQNLGRYFDPETVAQMTVISMEQIGKQTVTVSYKGFTDSFDVEVRPMIGIRITQPPTKVNYAQGEDFSRTGLEVMGVWNGIPEERISVESRMISGYDANTPGVQRVTITESTYGVSPLTATLDVEVLRLASIVMGQPPNKTDYLIGERLNTAGMVVNGNYVGTTAAKTMTQAIPSNQITTSGFDSSAFASNQRITATSRGQTTTFTVNINYNPAALIGTWLWVSRDGMEVYYTFNAEGVGYTANIPERVINWSLSGNTLSITSPTDTGGNVIAWTITSVSGDTLNLTSDHSGTAAFTKQK